MIKSPLRYPGGKSRAINLISKLVPEFNEYREPFVGGGSLFVYLKQLLPKNKYWINDLYEPLYYFWLQTKMNPINLIELIKTWKNEYQTGKDLFAFLKKNYDSFNIEQKAAAFFIFNRITFSGTSDSGGFSEAAYKGRFTDSSIDRVKKIVLLTKDIIITNNDYQELVDANGDNVFIFLDPPYYSATKSALYGKNGNLHKGFDHVRFADVMKKCNHKWLITYDDSKYIRDLFSFAHIIPWNLKYGMRNVTNNSDQDGKELFISNYIDAIPNEAIVEKHPVQKLPHQLKLI